MHMHHPHSILPLAHTHAHTLPPSPVHQLHLDLWQVFIQSLHPQLVLVLQGLVQLMVPVQSPWTHVPRVESLLGRERERGERGINNFYISNKTILDLCSFFTES